MPFFKRRQEKQKTPPVLCQTAAKKIPSNWTILQSSDFVNGDIGLPTSALGSKWQENSPQSVLSGDALSSPDDFVESGPSPRSSVQTSRLSKTFCEILHDKDALHCFIQFMEAKQADRFIKFWLDAESFHAATLTRLHTHSLQSVGRSGLLQRRHEMKEQAGRNSVCSFESEAEIQTELRESSDGQKVSYAEDWVDTGGGASLESRVHFGEKEIKSLSHLSPFRNVDNTATCYRVPHFPSVYTERTIVGEVCPSATPCINDLPMSLQKCTDDREVTGTSAVEPTLCDLQLLSAMGKTENEKVRLAEEKEQAFANNISSLNIQASETGRQDSRHDVNKRLGYGSNITERVLGDTVISTPVVEDKGKLPKEGSKQESDSGRDHADSARDNVSLPTQERSVEGVENMAVTVSDDALLPAAVERFSEGGRMPHKDISIRDRTVSQSEEIQHKLKKSIERDAVAIFTKYIAQDASQSIGVDDNLRGETIRKICKDDGQVDPDCFVACQQLVIDKMEKEYFQTFTDSEFHCKHQVNVLTSGRVYLSDILYNEHALCYFMEFMEQDGASNLMQFWIAADNFQLQLLQQQQQGGYDGMQAQADAMILYDKFFSLQASTPLGFDDKIRFEVESNICHEGGPLPDCFSVPHSLTLYHLDQFYFPRYLKSEIYYRYLSDLVNTVQIAQDIPVRKHRRQASDASSEHSAGGQSIGAESISSKNTLLAAGSRKALRATSPRSAPVLGKFEEHFTSMDSDFFNPDTLWERPCKGSLSLGKVNSLGQFVSEFESDPDGEKKKGGGFFRKKKEKEKEQEEMAVRVAQMILNDVAAMTKTGEACRVNIINDPYSLLPHADSASPAHQKGVSFFEPPPS